MYFSVLDVYCTDVYYCMFQCWICIVGMCIIVYFSAGCVS